MSYLRHDFAAPAVARRTPARVARGLTAQASGARAEDRVADRYAAAGCDILERRWRGTAGEIDLILRDGDEIVFVEVKKAASLWLAAHRLDRRQMDRICRTAAAYCDRFANGSLTFMRFDAAWVDEAGQIEIVPDAFGLD